VTNTDIDELFEPSLQDIIEFIKSN